jgi:hypothetical protein
MAEALMSEDYSGDESPAKEDSSGDKGTEIEPSRTVSVELTLSGARFFEAKGSDAAVCRQLVRLNEQLKPLCQLSLALYQDYSISAAELWSILTSQKPGGRLQIQCKLKTNDRALSARLCALLRSNIREQFRAPLCAAVGLLLERARPDAQVDGSWHQLCLSAALLFMTGMLPIMEAPPELKELAQDASLFWPLIGLAHPDADHGPLPVLVSMTVSQKECFWKNLPPSAQTLRNMEAMLTHVGHQSLPQETLLAHSSLYTVLVLRGLLGTPEERAQYLLSLPYSERTMGQVLQTSGPNGDAFRAHLARAAAALQESAWRRFEGALVEGGMRDKFLEPLLDAAHAVALRKLSRWRPPGLSTEREYWTALTSPTHREIQTMYQKIMGLDTDSARVQTFKQHALRRGIFLDHALHLFSLEEALEQLLKPRSLRRRRQEILVWNSERVRFSLLLLYGRLPELLVRKVALKAAQLARSPPSSDQPEICAEDSLVADLAKLVNLLLSSFQLQPNEEGRRWCRNAWQTLFAIQAAMQSAHDEPQVKRLKLVA